MADREPVVDPAGSAPPVSGRRALHYFAVAAAAVFAVELVIMLLLARLPTLSPWPEALLDGSLLVLLLLPILYVVVVRPLDREHRRYRSAEEARRSLLGEVAYSDHLLLGLGQAAEAVQRARTPDEIYRAVGDSVAQLGYHASVFTLIEDRTHLAATYLDFGSDVLRAAERLTGLRAEGYSFPLTPGGLYERVIAEGRVVFGEPAGEAVVEPLPALLRPLAGRLAAVLDIRQYILAPLTVSGERIGLLVVTGSDLTEADVPGVTVFASQTAIALENVRLYQDALASVHTLRGLLPICAHCKKIRDDTGYWDQIETYIAHRSEAEFSHGICPECAREHFPDYLDEDDGPAPVGR